MVKQRFAARLAPFASAFALTVAAAAGAAGPIEIVGPDPAMVGEQVKGELPQRAASRVVNPPGLVVPAVVHGQGYAGEVEPNGTTATATPLSGTSTVVRAPLFPNGDVDFYSFTAAAGDRVYAATMTSGSAGSSTDSQLTLLASDGTTVIEFDDDNGSFAGLSSSIAGAVIPGAGTYFLRVNDFTAGTTSERPYELHFRLQSGAPTAEVEPNDTPATANVLPANGWVSGARNPAAATEQDWYSFTANAGDTVFLSLDVDPEDDLVVWNGRLGLGLFGDVGNQILVADDAGTGDVTPNPNRPSEAFFMTVKTTGTYFAFVDSASAANGGPTATYQLSVTVRPSTPEGVNCTTYTSTNVPQTIGPGTGLVSSTITVPGNPRVADLDVEVVLNHAIMNQIDAQLRSPAGQDIGLFTDIGAAAAGGQTQMDLVFDDEAGVTPAFTALRGIQVKPENNSTAGTASASGAYRLAAFDGINAGGTWTLDLRDDVADANGGTLTAWSLRICEAPPPPACPAGFAQTTVYSTDFESGAAGFTSSGTANEWELGLPATVATTTANPIAPFNTCNSGTSCWKTDLDNTYDASSNQDLLSPAINLAGLSPPIVVRWAQRHQVESANFDRMFVDFQQVGGATPVRLYEWIDPTVISASAGTGNPQVNIGSAYGWGVFERRVDSLAGQNTELRFHLDSDTTVNFAGLAIDDVSVTACRALSADLAVTKTNGTTTSVPGGSTTYTITASNAGPDPVTGATVADTFPAACTSVNWTCVGAGGGTCTAAGTGNLNDTVNLPSGGSVTYTATCAISAAATGTLANTATVSSSITDPTPGNNSATDSDTLTPQADLAITKTDGVTTVAPGGSTIYTITASNAGPSNAPGSTVADVFPASCTSVTWTCVGTGGGTCTAAGTGNINDTASLPTGGSTTYTATCAISAVATGSLVNTATVAAAAGVTDPTPGNNSATDTDTLAASADLSITKTDGVASIAPGGTLTYTIVASNATGPSAATGATVSDTWPAQCNAPVAWTCTGAGGATCPASGTGNLAATVNLPIGGSTTFSGTCVVAAGTAGGTVVSNTATVNGGTTGDPTPGNNTASDTTNVLSLANVFGTKTVAAAGGSFLPGATVTYTIVLNNTGGAQADNPGDEFVDVLPPQLTLLTATASAGTAVATVATNTVTWNGAIASAGSVTITITARINPGVGGTVNNQGTINYDGAGAGTNGSTRTTDNPGLPGTADPTGFTVFVSVPLFDRFGVVLLGLAMLLVGAWTFRTRAARH
jgi:uncharacterized repeat protein (TIGR01451 family)